MPPLYNVDSEEISSKIIPRDCSNCGRKMKKMRGTCLLECKNCEIRELGVMKPRRSRRKLRPTGIMDGVEIAYIDHGKEYVPHP